VDIINDDSTKIIIILNSYLPSKDTIDFYLNKDEIENHHGYPPLDSDTLTFYTAILSDYNNDNAIDAVDVQALIDYWSSDNTQMELGPTTGTAPHLIINPDQQFSVLDIITFGKMWDWDTENTLARFTVMPSSYDAETAIFAESGKLMFSTRTINDEKIFTMRVLVSNIDPNAPLFKVRDMDNTYDLIFNRQWADSSLFEYTLGSFIGLDSIILQIAEYNTKYTRPIDIDVIYEIYNRQGMVLSSGIESINIIPIPDEFMLNNIYPNPFNASTRILYNVPNKSNVELSIFNLRGRLVETLINKPVEAGYHSIIWDARKISSGIYFVRMKSPAYQSIKKCTIVK